MLSITQFEEYYLLKYNKCVEFMLDKEFVDEKLRIFANNLSNDKSTIVIFSSYDGDNSITYDKITSVYTHSILAFGDETRGAEFKMKLSTKNKKVISKRLLELKYVEKNIQKNLEYWTYQDIHIPLNIDRVKTMDDTNYIYKDGAMTEMFSKRPMLTLNAYRFKYAILKNDIWYWKVDKNDHT